MEYKMLETPYYGAADAFSLISKFFRVLAWIDGPNTVDGFFNCLTDQPLRAGECMPVGEVPFLFAGSRSEFFALVRRSSDLSNVMFNRRVVLDPSERARAMILSTESGEFGTKRKGKAQTDFSEFHSECVRSSHR